MSYIIFYKHKEAVRLARLGMLRICYELLIWFLAWGIFIFLFNFPVNDFYTLDNWLIRGRFYVKLLVIYRKGTLPVPVAPAGYWDYRSRCRSRYRSQSYLHKLSSKRIRFQDVAPTWWPSISYDFLGTNIRVSKQIFDFKKWMYLLKFVNFLYPAPAPLPGPEPVPDIRPDNRPELRPEKYPVDHYSWDIS